MTSFDNQAGSIVLGIPQFRKDFGTPYEGDYDVVNGRRSAIGSLCAGAIADRVGRKWTYALLYVLVVAGITLELFSTTNEIFFAGKFIASFANGSFIAISMTYIGEIAPVRLRGILTAAAPIAFAVGSFIVSLIVYRTGVRTDRWAYRTIFASQYAVTVLGMLLLPAMPESPWWLIGQEKDAKAERSLCRLGYSPEETKKRITIVFDNLQKARDEADGTSYFECFRKTNLRRTIISVAPLTIQAFSATSGVLDREKLHTWYSYPSSFYVGQHNILFLVDRVGRRDLTIWGMAILTVLLCVTGGLAVAATPGAIKGIVSLLLAYCYIYNATIGATAYTILAEVATARLRAKTASMALALQNTFFVSSAFRGTFQTLQARILLTISDRLYQANLGAKVTLIFGGLSVFGTIYLWHYQPETARRSYADLDELFKENVSARRFKSYQTVASMGS
ncbi:hypothetical protein SLS62_007887 [Diatrype stigma]|uniref:Major facilitator superfamily (MFS) profile domain-containing protein n=1 Tax=Diatrype stigma TaxID=117547 RepID=A0AAN9YLX0_9PEZI